MVEAGSSASEYGALINRGLHSGGSVQFLLPGCAPKNITEAVQTLLQVADNATVNAIERLAIFQGTLCCCP